MSVLSPGAIDEQWIMDQFSSFDGIYNWVAGLVDTEGATGVVSGYQETLIPVGMAICLLALLTNLINQGTSNKLTFETFIQFFVRIGVTVGLVESSSVLIDAGDALCSWTLNLLNIDSSALEDTSSSEKFRETARTIASQLSEINQIEKIFYSAIFLIANVGVILISCMIATVLISRLFEIAVMGVFLPVGIGFIADEGTQSVGLRYVKKFLALYLQGPAIYVCFKLYKPIQIIVTGIVVDAANSNLVMMILAPAIAVGLCGMGLLGATKSMKGVTEAAMGV